MIVKKAFGVVVAIGAVAAGASGYWFFAHRADNDRGAIRVSGNIEITDAELSFKIPGRVETRRVDEGHFVESGRYWHEQDRFDPAEIDALDLKWLETLRTAVRDTDTQEALACTRPLT